MPTKGPWLVTLALPIGVAVLAAALSLLVGPPQLLAKSESPDFCASCHIHEAEYEAWFHQGAHRRLKCVDCHLPNGDPASHYAWKAVDGMKDFVVFNAGRVPENIRISAHGRRIVQGNCIRCHAETVDRIDRDRQCTDCHRRIMHTRSGGIETR